MLSTSHWLATSAALSASTLCMPFVTTSFVVNTAAPSLFTVEHVNCGLRPSCCAPRQQAASLRRRQHEPREVPTMCIAISLKDLRKVQREQGGIVGSVSYDQGHECNSVLLSGFAAGVSLRRRAEKVDHAVRSEALLVDKSHWGIIRVRGEDRMRFLHSQGTNAFDGASKGTVVPTCFTTNVGRVVDFCEGVILEEEVWLLSSPHRWRTLLETMDKFIFPMDKTTVSSLSEETAVFFLAGPQAAESIALAGCEITPRPGGFVEWEYEGQKVIVLGHARSMTRGAGGGVLEGASERVSPGVAVQEYSVLVPSSVSAKLWSALSESPSVLVAGEQEWQTLRIRQGFPFPGKELTNDYNPLEAGLWHTVHFDKGCYIGQETISRVNAYMAVKTVLCGVSFEEGVGQRVSEGDELVAEESGIRAGVVTSLITPVEGLPRRGLAYVRTQAGGFGLKVHPSLKVTTKGGVRGTIIQVPYPTRSDAESAKPPVKKKEGAQGPETSLDLEDEKAKERARKAAKLEAMQKKLDALKARRKAA